MRIPRPETQDFRAIAALAKCDPRTVSAHLAGRRVHPTIAAAIETALATWARENAPDLGAPSARLADVRSTLARRA